ncbi:MAG: SH3 domain-containing protein [Clostridia bacterium]|nr:SH3 domain-containing protein [Clostridia bacterium]
MRMNLLKKGTALLAALCLLATGLAPLPALAEGTASAPLTVREGAQSGMVRVYLSSLGQPSSLNLTICGSYSLDGTDATALANGSTVTVGFSSSTGRLTLKINGVTTDMGTEFRLCRHDAAGDNGVKISQARVGSNIYPGDIQFKSVQSGGTYRLYTIVHVFIEDYLYGVLPYEMGNSAPLEALKAQCVSARTYTVRAMESSAARSYDVVDTTSDQVYNGTPAGNARCRQAVDETRGIVSMNGTAYTATYYTASNGGQIESVRNIWGSTNYDYIRVKDDPYDLQNPDSVVKSFRVSAAGAQSNSTLSSRLVSKAKAVFGASNVTINSVTAVTPHTPRYAAPSRLYTKLDFDVTVTADGVEKSGTLTFDIFSELESALGMSINGSNNELWSVTRTSTGYLVEARRFGHGTGLSQRGAIRMAELGYTYDRILAFYFEGCQRVQVSFYRSVRSALGSGTSQEVLSVEAPAEVTPASNAVGVVQMSGADAEMALRVSASYDADIIAGIPHGAAVTVHAAANGWYLVTYGQLTGWAQGDGISFTGAADGQSPAVTTLAAYGTVSGTSYLHLRASASTSSESLAQIPAGTDLPLLSVSGGWGLTQYGCQTGYVSMSYVTRSDHYSGSAKDANATGATVTASSGAPLYLSASTAGYRAMVVAPGETVKVKYNDGSWCQVYYQGVTGYMRAIDLVTTGAVVEETPDTPAAGEQYALVSSAATSLNLREGANMSSTVMMEIPRGETVIVESAGKDWCRVRYNGVRGYCATQYLTLGVSGADVTEDGNLSAVVTTESGSLNLRKSDSTQSAILTQIPRGATVTVLSKGTTWCKVTYGGFVGYSMTKFLTFGSAAAATPTPTPTPTPAAATPTPTPASVLPAQAMVTTASGSLNLRKTPSTGAAILLQIPQYATVSVLGISGTWTQVSYGGKTGYVMSVFLTYIYAESNTPTPPPAAQTPTPTPTPSPTPATATYARVTTVSGGLNLRKKASATAAVLTVIPQNEVIPVEENLGSWVKTAYNGKSGYVMTAFLTFVEVPVPVQPSPTENVSGQVMTAMVATEKGSLNLRERASSKAKVLTTIPQYATVTVLTRGSDWSQVTYGKYTGYVMSSFLAFTAAAPTSTPPPVQESGEPYARVSTEQGSLNLRKTDSTNAAILTTIPQYTVIQVLQKGAVWTYVTYNGYTGYVKTEFLTFLASAQEGASSGLSELAVPLTVRVRTAYASVALRSAASDSAPALATVLGGEYLRVTARGADWCRVEYEGLTGYLPAASLELP